MATAKKINSGNHLPGSGDDRFPVYSKQFNEAVDVLNGDMEPTSVASSGAVTSSSATAGVGYATGAGSAVTQITSASTAVTIDTPTGQITTVALTTAAAAEEEFTVNNASVAATDVVVLSTTYDGAGTPAFAVKKVAAGAFNIVITNLHAANAFDAVMVINYAVIKGVAA